MMRNFFSLFFLLASIFLACETAFAQSPITPVPDSVRVDSLPRTHYETIKQYLEQQDSVQHHHEKVHPEMAWSGFGFGATQSATFDVRSTIDGIVCWQKNGWVYSATIQYVGNFDPTGSIPETIFDLGALFGTAISERPPLLNVSAGVGFIHRRTSDHASDGTLQVSKTQWGLSVPVQVQLLKPFSDIFGVALIGYANLNVLNPTFGLLINICSGRFEDPDSPTTNLW